MDYSKIRNLNIGSGRKKIEGYANMDGLDWDGNTDIQHDLTDVPYPIKDGQIEHIVCMEVLEHISFRKLGIVLEEFYRVLKKGGKLSIQVPDCGKMMEYEVNGQVCACVPHKDTGDGFKADPNCYQCKGKGKVNPVRWIYAFTGAQKHNFDYHNSLFTKQMLEDSLRKARFFKFEYKEDINKIRVSCYK